MVDSILKDVEKNGNGNSVKVKLSQIMPRGISVWDTSFPFL